MKDQDQDLDPSASELADRFTVLRLASLAIAGREQNYGKPERNFAHIAAMWSAFLGVAIEPWMVGAMMTMLKYSRLKHDPKHLDSHVDACGYACVTAEAAFADVSGR